MAARALPSIQQHLGANARLGGTSQQWHLRSWRCHFTQRVSLVPLVALGDSHSLDSKSGFRQARLGELKERMAKWLHPPSRSSDEAGSGLGL